MNKVALIISVDYELFGDGSGIVTREQIITTEKLAGIANKYGVKLTIMFEYAQYRAYEKYGVQNKKFLDDNKKIRAQLISLLKDGHDIQLHYHAQWDEAVYEQESDTFKVNINQIDFSTLPYETIIQRLKEGKKFLEKLLQPYNPEYECIGFRAGSWAVKNQKKLLDALVETGFRSDSSVVPNVKFESEQVNFEYTNCPHRYHYWYVDNTLLTSVGSKSFIEIPIYTNKHPFAFLKYFNNKYLMTRKILNKIYKIKLSEKNFSQYQKIKKILMRNYYMADLNTMQYKTLIQMTEDVINDKRFSNEEIIPIMMISHSKTSYALDDLNLFFSYLQEKYNNNIEYWGYQKSISYLIENKKQLNNKKTIRLLKSESEIDFTLPILGQEKYLKTKSCEYGWLKNDSFVIAFFIDKRLIFKRLVFTMNILSKNQNYSIQTQDEFLNEVVDYIKKHTLCDFIYKAQSNVIFHSCPNDSICIPWGTYKIDLNKSEEELFNSFNSKCRNAIRKALKEDVRVKQTENTDLIYNNIRETLQRQHSIHFPSYDYIDSLQKNLENNVIFLIAIKDSVVQGSLILIYDSLQGYAMYAGSIQKPVTGSLDLLHFEAMKYLQNKHIKIYDFVGTRLNIKKGSKQEGIDRFKRKFNPTLREGCAFRVIINPKKYFLFTIVSKIYLQFKGYSYSDPISEIKDDCATTDKILLMGPHYNTKDPQMVGGPIVLFEDLLSQLNKNDINYIVIDTNKKNYTSVCHAYLSIFFQFMYNFFSCSHISLHSSRDYMIFGAPVVLFGKLFNKNTSLRKFGGEALKTYKEANYIKKRYLKMIFTGFDNLYMETKYLVSFFSDFNKSTFWFPNVRKRKVHPNLPKEYKKKFVFISHVIREKGIREIIKASSYLDDTYTIDIYGPLIHEHFSEKDFEKTKVHYKGVLKADQVLSKLNEYDVVLLPSYKEGYPGIIIEAYSLGIPVIATSLDGIKEIVDEYHTGLLVEPKSVTELVQAMQYYNEENYVKMSRQAYQKFNEFESDTVTQKFIKTALM